MSAGCGGGKRRSDAGTVGVGGPRRGGDEGAREWRVTCPFLPGCRELNSSSDSLLALGETSPCV